MLYFFFVCVFLCIYECVLVCAVVYRVLLLKGTTSARLRCSSSNQPAHSRFPPPPAPKQINTPSPIACSHHQVEMVPRATRFKAVQQATIRAAPSIDSIGVGKLDIGEVVDTCDMISNEEGLWYKLEGECLTRCVEATMRHLDAWVLHHHSEALGGTVMLESAEDAGSTSPASSSASASASSSVVAAALPGTAKAASKAPGSGPVSPFGFTFGAVPPSAFPAAPKFGARFGSGASSGASGGALLYARHVREGDALVWRTDSGGGG